jgi:DNA-3-methyladenine glycosylase II
MEQTTLIDGPFDADLTLSRFHLWGEDLANRLGRGVFHRAVRVDGRAWGYALRWAGDRDDARLTVSVPGTRSARVLDAAVADARWVCGADLDFEAFYRAVKGDRVLGPLVPRLYGLRPTLTPRAFEMLVGSVCAQQVNLTFAFTVRARLVKRYGEAVTVDGVTVYAFPEPARLARVDPAALRSLQFTTRKSEYIVGLAGRIASGELDLDGLAARGNDEVIEAITRVRGFGRWSAEWFLCRGLGRGDVCPAGDLGVRRAFEHFYNRARALAEPAIRRRATAWGMHQNLAIHYLLAGRRLDTAAAGGGT